jgi:transcriptional regulator with XRE-family HTH domain
MDPEPLERLPLAELIVEERRCQSLSLADVAALVRKSAEDEGKQSGATRQTAHNWERGQIPRPDSLRWLARALGLPTERMASAAAQQAAMRRRELLRTATVLAGAFLVPDMPSVGPASKDRPGALGIQELDEVAGHLRRVFAEFSTADWLLGPRLVLASVTGHLALVEQLLARMSSDRSLELLSLGARYAEFSSWLYQDVGDPRAASCGPTVPWNGRTKRAIPSWCPMFSPARATRPPPRATGLALSVSHERRSSSRATSLRGYRRLRCSRKPVGSRSRERSSPATRSSTVRWSWLLSASTAPRLDRAAIAALSSWSSNAHPA